MLSLENKFIFQIFQFTQVLNDFLSSDLQENSYEVLMGQIILGNEKINVVKTGYLDMPSAPWYQGIASLKSGREPLMLRVSNLRLKVAQLNAYSLTDSVNQ